LTFAVAVCFAALAGFISLSSEILWFRVYSYLTGGSPVTFGLMLGIYLAGLATGADVAGRFCRKRGEGQSAKLLVPFALGASGVTLLVAPAMAFSALSPGRGWLALFSVMLAAALFGALLPLVSHSGIAPDLRAGQKLSYIYFANVAGSVSGTLLTGFVLVDFLSTREIALFLAITGLLLALIGSFRKGCKPSIIASVVLLSIGAAYVWANPRLFDRLYERLQFKDTYRGQRFTNLVENRHGIVAVTDYRSTFGGGVYDGYVSTDLVNDRNAIQRAYAIVAVHPHPRKVLIIGMATGAWSQVVANSPAVDSVTIVEINPGYLKLIRQYTQVAGLLRNPKVHIIIDDGRRWLRRNQHRRFDLVVSNTTFHYRENSTNLLSSEFLKLVHSHLEPGGIFYFNTTNSQDALKTAFTEFENGMRIANFVAVSDLPMQLDSTRWYQVLSQYHIDGAPVFDLTDSAHVRAFDLLMRLPGSINRPPVSRGLETRASVLARIPAASVITDDNMLPEWRTLLLRSSSAQY
jgi:spermidine synthase